MTEQNTEALIAEARRMVRHSSVSVPEHANMLDRLSDELENMRTERNNWKLSAEEAERAEKRWKHHAHSYSAKHDAKVRAEEREKAAQIAEDAPGTEASGYYAGDHQMGYQEAQSWIAARIREQGKEQGS